ncbi:DUF2723 domain-containing protein [Nemorincola caseinilytica]|uniref:DUF2723 domain-containing protein n=1 Tax=Nemorincola caseinilytica TaxID=2054315 RepID=A0ABP8NQU7_9BACT
MNYRKVNNLTGWVVCAIATAVYLMTMERVTSFWDCGEFLSCAYKLEVGHSPGAPFFMLLQRIFALFSGPAAWTGAPSTNAAFFINSLSVFASSFSILFLFWTITHFGKKLVAGSNTEPDNAQTVAIMGAGLVGALACTFSDTFWFSAVEGEVYATSSLFTAFTFWAMLKWEEIADNKYADRWLVLLSFLVGLSVCVHLLNLLTIPALAMIYYFKRYKPTTMGTIIAFLVGCVILGFIQFGVIQYIPRIASVFDRVFTNDLGMPFDTGAIVFLLLLSALLVFLLLFAKKKGYYLMHTGMLCIIFIIIGYSCYFTAIIRSRADVPIDMTNPDNPMSFLDYVNREQFGQQPLFFGPYFTSVWTDVDATKKTYAPMKKDGKDVYEVVGSKTDPVFGIDPRTGESQSHFFPRIWDYNSPSHISFYRSYLGLDENETPTARDNFSFFFRYQMNWMWWRFFMWNFAGRQNDVEGQGAPDHGNWISGISFIDGMRGLGNTDNMGDLSRNQAHNKLYFLPFILGILGFIYQFDRNKRDGIAVLTLFFFTGAAIGIFLNMTPLQPRERDYAFAGCTYTFTIWIGLGALMIYDMLRKRIGNGAGAAYGAVAVSLLAAPVLMAAEEWDDHDRSRKTLANATAYNTLSCCAPNAILFTYGDNQTYPLWYIQEIEGFRRDVRIINTSLLGIDWYIDQLNNRANDGMPVPMIWKKQDYIGDKHNYVQFYEPPTVKIPKDRYFNLEDICNFMNSTDPDKTARRGDEIVNYMPVKNFMTPTPSKEELVARGLIGAEDTVRVVTDMRFSFPKNAATKSDLAVLNIIAGVARDGWKRPIYFDAGLRQSDYVGTGEYMRMEGMVYRLMPFKVMDSVRVNPSVLGTINTAKSYDMFMNKFVWGGAEREDVYFDEPNRHELISYRMNAAFLANQLIAEGQRDKAVQILDKVNKNITEHSYPYGYDYSGYLLAAAYYHAGEKEKGARIANKIMSSTEKNLQWIASLNNDSRFAMADGAAQHYSIMQGLGQAAYEGRDSVTMKAIVDKMQGLFERNPKLREILEARQNASRQSAPAGDE